MCGIHVVVAYKGGKRFAYFKGILCRGAPLCVNAWCRVSLIFCVSKYVCMCFILESSNSILSSSQHTHTHTHTHTVRW